MIEDLLTDGTDEFSEHKNKELLMPTLNMTEGQVESLNIFGKFVNSLILIMIGAMLLVVLYELIINYNYIIPFFG